MKQPPKTYHNGVSFTYLEATVKKYTLGDVNRAIDARLRNKRHNGICVNAISHLHKDSRLTLVELNELVDSVVWDTMVRA